MSETKRCPTCGKRLTLEGGLGNPEWRCLNCDSKAEQPSAEPLYDRDKVKAIEQEMEYDNHFSPFLDTRCLDGNYTALDDVDQATAGEAEPSVSGCDHTKECGFCHAEVSILRSQLAALQAQMEKMRKYATHKRSCIQLAPASVSACNPCSCGFDSLSYAPSALLAEHDAQVRRETVEECIKVVANYRDKMCGDQEAGQHAKSACSFIIMRLAALRAKETT